MFLFDSTICSYELLAFLIYSPHHLRFLEELIVVNILRAWRIMPLIIMITLLSTIPLQVYAQPKPRWNANTATIEASGIVVQFFERKPQYRFWLPGENETAVYIVKFVKIIEFLDSDNDNQFDFRSERILAKAELDAHDQWNITAMVLEGSSNSTELRVIMQGYVAVITTAEGMMANEKANVTFINHIYDKDVEVEGYVVKGGAELKIDVIISNWPWHSNDSKLALMTLFAGHFRGKKRIPTMHHERVRERNTHRVEMRDPETNHVGVFTFRENVRIRSKNGSTYEMKVNATDDFRPNSAIQYIVYPHFEGTLEHDPSILIEKEEESMVQRIFSSPYIWMGIILTIVVIGVIIVKRR